MEFYKKWQGYKLYVCYALIFIIYYCKRVCQVIDAKAYALTRPKGKKNYDEKCAKMSENEQFHWISSTFEWRQ